MQRICVIFFLLTVLICTATKEQYNVSQAI